MTGRVDAKHPPPGPLGEEVGGASSSFGRQTFGGSCRSVIALGPDRTTVATTLSMTELITTPTPTPLAERLSQVRPGVPPLRGPPGGRTWRKCVQVRPEMDALSVSPGGRLLSASQVRPSLTF
jgi:hypothetical protein